MYSLLEVSECEQMLACHDEHSASLQQVQRLVASNNTSDLDATRYVYVLTFVERSLTRRLVMLYALHYERHSSNEIDSLKAALRRRRVPEKYVQVGRDVFECV